MLRNNAPCVQCFKKLQIDLVYGRQNYLDNKMFIKLLTKINLILFLNYSYKQILVW